jgi:RNA polymerase sigma-70 factor (ECF subfamily)
VFRRFANRLVGLARARLAPRIRPKADPEDVAQSALKSFFLRHAEAPFELDGWDGLWSLLVVITVRKCGRRAAKLRAARRDIDREVPPPADSGPAWEVADPEPTPDEAVVLAETVEQLMAALPDPAERQALQLRLQGYTVPEISDQVKLSERTVHRVLARVKQRLQRQRDTEPADGAGPGD